MKLRIPELAKLAKSALISGLGLGIVVLLRFLFPDFDWTPVLTAILTAIGAWLVNTVKESLGL